MDSFEDYNDTMFNYKDIIIDKIDTLINEITRSSHQLWEPY